MAISQTTFPSSRGVDVTVDRARQLWQGAKARKRIEVAIAAAVITVTSTGAVAATTMSKSATATCTAHDPVNGAAVTGPTRAVRMLPVVSAEVALPDRPPLGRNGSGHWEAVLCGSTFSDLVWRADPRP